VTMTISRASLKVKAIGQNSRSPEENFVKVINVTASEGFLVFISILKLEVF